MLLLAVNLPKGNPHMLKPIGCHTLSVLAAAALPSLGQLTAGEAGLDALRPPQTSSLKASPHRQGRHSNRFILDSDLVTDTTLRREHTYIVHGEVHVRAGVTLTIEDGATILIRNGLLPRRSIDTSALIFDSGSRLRAGTVTFASADTKGSRVKRPDNGGVCFCGSHKSGTKDGISSDGRAPRSDFRAERIILDHVGRPDPLKGDGNDNDRDDIDAVSLIGVGRKEWNVKGIESHSSGDDGFDAYNSSIALDTLIVTNPTEDGVNLTSSDVTIHCSCSIEMSRSKAPDRELFDFEIDNGRCAITIEPSALVKLSGFWGNEADDALLESSEMPRPPALAAPNIRYEFDGTLSKRAMIRSNSTD